MLVATLRQAANRFGDRTAYVSQRPGDPSWNRPRTLTYQQLDTISTEIAIGLGARGVGRGDRVALILPASFEYLLCYLAAAKLGAITAGINDRLTASERAAILRRCSPSVVIAQTRGDARSDEMNIADDGRYDTVILEPAETIDGLARALREVPKNSTRASELLGEGDVGLDDDLAIIFTSGTTGEPKGARYSHRQVDFITHTDLGAAWDLGGRSFSGTSFAHLGFMTKLEGNLRRGGTMFIIERWRADTCLELLSSQRMTTIGGVPAQLALMLQSPTFAEHDLTAVQYIIAGGGPISPGLAEEVRRRFDAKLQTRYSCTEAGIGLGTAFDDPLEDAIVSVGRPHPGVELALRATTSDDTDRAPAAADGAASADVEHGTVGEVCLRSPACMRSYYNDPVASAAAFTADGFVRTGDLGYIDDRGRVRLVGRSKEMYVRGGYNVYPVEVEAALSEHPSVAAIAIVPRTDPVMGEIGVAVVVAREGAAPPTLNELRDFAATRLARHKLPEAIMRRDALPLTAMDKLDRRLLHDEATRSTPDR